ncbi:hypothetical protein K469DRAFT_701942 [Zopfia rhizophila CBS 207.26]|uniref:F-box domain-containing protein n=1 Tax=Zopfia rhizophila CBS 207.26 TaxID=1314779 RepID=A0A6A6EBT8_9PEZI|nr:hypothetical protein K469DRAFT_701942 [Zopfia rhizophila CBS 207.26]
MMIHDVTDDVLIPVFQRCFLNDIFTLRLISKSLRAVVDTYIRTIAPCVVRQTFPTSSLPLQPPVNGPSFWWLKDLIPRYMTAVALDKDKLRRFPYLNSGFLYGIPHED